MNDTEFKVGQFVICTECTTSSFQEGEVYKVVEPSLEDGMLRVKPIVNDKSWFDGSKCNNGRRINRGKFKVL